MMAQHLTGRAIGYRAYQVLAFVRRFTGEHGRAPSYCEIRAELGINSNGEISRIVSGLEKRGLLSRVGKGKVRRIGRGHRRIVQ